MLSQQYDAITLSRAVFLFFFKSPAFKSSGSCSWRVRQQQTDVKLNWGWIIPFLCEHTNRRKKSCRANAMKRWSPSICMVGGYCIGFRICCYRPLEVVDLDNSPSPSRIIDISTRGEVAVFAYYCALLCKVERMREPTSRCRTAALVVYKLSSNKYWLKRERERERAVVWLHVQRLLRNACVYTIVERLYNRVDEDDLAFIDLQSNCTKTSEGGLQHQVARAGCPSGPSAAFHCRTGGSLLSYNFILLWSSLQSTAIGWLCNYTSLPAVVWSEC